MQSFESFGKNLINPVEHSRIMATSLEAKICGTNHLFEEKGEEDLKGSQAEDFTEKWFYC